LRRVATASCLAIKGQEFLRIINHRAARLYFYAAIRAGSHDIKDLLCRLATRSPYLLRQAVSLYGDVSPCDATQHKQKRVAS
jgi:hypothetical protein